jgi:hypothetical protein
MTNHRLPWVLATTALAAGACATTEPDHAQTITGSQNLAPYDTDSIMEYRNTAFCDVAIYDVAAATGVTRIKTLTQGDVPGMAPETGDRFGASLAHADLDADLFDDLVIGVPGENSSQGVIALVRGAGLPGWTWRGEKDDGFTRQAGDGFGTAVAAGRFGDIDDDPSSRNDAPADFAAGAPFRQPNGVASAGSFQEFYGQSA